MDRRVIRSLFVAAALLLTPACDKGGDVKSDAGTKVDTKKVDEPTPEVIPEPTPEVTAEAGAEAGAEVAAEAGAEVGVDTAAAAEAEAGETGEAEVEAPKPDDKPEPTDKSTDKPKPDKPEPAATAKIDGKPLYLKKCKSCHGVDGKGDTTIGKKVEIPSLVGTKLSQAKVVSTIESGVPDTKMKGYKGKLTADEIDAIASFVKRL